MSAQLLKNSVLPLVSILATCYNHERFVRECLDSIKEQNYPNLQLIITDDCSKDSSLTLIQEWIRANPSLDVLFVQNKKNLGLCKVLNNSLSIAKGRYITLIATDDIWEAHKTSAQVRLMESLPEKTGVVYSDAYQINENSSLLPKRFIETWRTFDQMPEGYLHEILWDGNFIPAMTTMIRRSVFEKVGYFDEKLFYEDWDMWLRISKCYDFVYYQKPTAKYRIVRTSISKASADKMKIADEIMFSKYLLHRQVPRRLLNKAFNYTVRRAFRQKEAAREGGRKLLNAALSRYKSPRLFYAWLLFVCGFQYRHYEKCLNVGKIVARLWKLTK